MMILKRKNPNAHRQNALQFTESDGICCADGTNEVVCRYTLTLATGTVGTLSKIGIDGQEYNFATAVPTTTREGARLVKESIEAVLYQLGYTSDGIGVSLIGTKLIVSTALSLAAFDYLEAAGNAFQKTACRTIGDFKGPGDKADTEVGAEIIRGELVVQIGSTVDVINARVTSTNTTTYDGPVSGGIVRTPTAIASGATEDVTVVVTYADSTTASFTVSVTNPA